MPTGPGLEDYLKLFALYGDVVETAWRDSDPDTDRLHLLFEQVVRLLARGSAFNAGLPEPFLRTARGYVDGEEAVLRQMEDPDARHFMLSDLYDYFYLLRRGQAG